MSDARCFNNDILHVRRPHPKHSVPQTRASRGRAKWNMNGRLYTLLWCSKWNSSPKERVVIFRWEKNVWKSLLLGESLCPFGLIIKASWTWGVEDSWKRFALKWEKPQQEHKRRKNAFGRWAQPLFRKGRRAFPSFGRAFRRHMVDARRLLHRLMNSRSITSPPPRRRRRARPAGVVCHRRRARPPSLSSPPNPFLTSDEFLKWRWPDTT